MLCLAALCIGRTARAQDGPAPVDPAEMTLGMGVGLDFGGLGLQLSGRPEPPLNIFVAMGYNLNEVGLNAGVAFRTLPRAVVCPFVMGMYGYNAVIAISGRSDYDKTYYGPTVGGGLEIRAPHWRGHLELGVFHPFRNATFEEDLEMLQRNPAVEDLQVPSAWTFSVGYHMGL